MGVFLVRRHVGSASVRARGRAAHQSTSGGTALQHSPLGWKVTSNELPSWLVYAMDRPAAAAVVAGRRPGAAEDGEEDDDGPAARGGALCDRGGCAARARPRVGAAHGVRVTACILVLRVACGVPCVRGEEIKQ
jgi:hypothetical protein